MTRLHYATLLEDALTRLEAHFVKRAKGKSFLGIHRTMHEETSDDFLIGCSDYFRHNRFTRPAFTDSVFEREDSMIAMFHLARSMGFDHGNIAFNNSWGFVPTEAHHDYYLSLMAAMKVGWIGHTYHSSHIFGPGYPDHPLWKTLPKHLDEHERVMARLDGAVPEADMAIVYNWRALATYAGNYMHVHRRNLLLLAKALTFQNVQFRFVDVDRQDLRGFRRVIVPWADFLSPQAWRRLSALSPDVELTIFGPPAERDSEGDDVRRQFAKLAGVTQTSPMRLPEATTLRMGTQQFVLSPMEIEPNYHSNQRNTYPDHFKAFALRPAHGATPLASIDGKVVGTQRGNVRYFACELAHFAGLPEALWNNPDIRAPRGLLCFTYRRGDQRILCITSRWSKPITGTVRWGSHGVAVKPGQPVFAVADVQSART